MGVILRRYNASVALASKRPVKLPSYFAANPIRGVLTMSLENTEETLKLS